MKKDVRKGLKGKNGREGVQEKGRSYETGKKYV